MKSNDGNTRIEGRGRGNNNSKRTSPTIVNAMENKKSSQSTGTKTRSKNATITEGPIDTISLCQGDDISLSFSLISSGSKKSSGGDSSDTRNNEKKIIEIGESLSSGSSASAGNLGNNSDNSEFFSLANNTFGFNFDSEEQDVCRMGGGDTSGPSSSAEELMESGEEGDNSKEYEEDNSNNKTKNGNNNKVNVSKLREMSDPQGGGGRVTKAPLNPVSSLGSTAGASSNSNSKKNRNNADFSSSSSNSSSSNFYNDKQGNTESNDSSLTSSTSRRRPSSPQSRSCSLEEAAAAAVSSLQSVVSASTASISKKRAIEKVANSNSSPQARKKPNFVEPKSISSSSNNNSKPTDLATPATTADSEDDQDDDSDEGYDSDNEACSSQQQQQRGSTSGTTASLATDLSSIQQPQDLDNKNSKKDSSEGKKINRREQRNAREKERSLRIAEQISELRGLLTKGGVIVPKCTKSHILTEAVSYIRMLQQHQYRSEVERHNLVQQMQMIGAGVFGSEAANTIRHYAAQNGVWSLGNFGGVPPRSAMTYYQPAGSEATTTSMNSTTNTKQTQDIRQIEKIEEHEYRYVFNSCGVAMAIASMGGAFIECNQLFCQLSQYTKQEICSMTIFNLTSRFDLQRAFDLISNMLCPGFSTSSDGGKSRDATFTTSDMPSIILRGSMKDNNSLGLNIALIKGADNVAKCFCVTLVKHVCGNTMMKGSTTGAAISLPVVPATTSDVDTSALARAAKSRQDSGNLMTHAYATG